MSIFPLAISCLTTSNLPWFMGLTFQLLMQYFSLQHQTLLSLQDTPTTERRFCFGPASAFFLELFLHSSPVAYWATTTRQVHLSVSYLFAFSYCSWGYGETVSDFILGGAQKSLQMVITAMNLKHTYSLEGKL